MEVAGGDGGGGCGGIVGKVGEEVWRSWPPGALVVGTHVGPAGSVGGGVLLSRAVLSGVCPGEAVIK